MPHSLRESLERHRPLSGPGLIKDRLNLSAVICQELFEGESRHCARARRRAAWTVRARLARFLPSLLTGISILGFRVTESIHRTTIQRAGPAWLSVETVPGEPQNSPPCPSRRTPRLGIPALPHES